MAVVAAACGSGEPRGGDTTAARAPAGAEPPGANPAESARDAPAPPSPAAAEDGGSVDYLTFANGAIPLSMVIDGAVVDDLEAAIHAIDGSPTPFSLVRQGKATTVAEIVYELPAATTFERFAIPEITEVPSRFITFVRDVEIHGSATSADAGFERLAGATLAAHASDGIVTELDVARRTPVRWIKVRLAGGLDVPEATVTLRFSELVGTGRQEPAALVDHFTGVWKGKGVLVELRQSGAAVIGCYDTNGGKLSGTVSGNLLKAIGVGGANDVPSVFVLAVTPGGELRGLRSTNGAPFKLHAGPRAPAGTTTSCSEQPKPTLGCGSVIHAITFAFDSATLRPESEAVLAELHAGLAADPARAIVIEGHTSSEGSKDHNLDLSRRRAEAVVDDLVRRGIARDRLTAAGMGPGRPIASNDDEAGRALNRRVEVDCR